VVSAGAVPAVTMAPNDIARLLSMMASFDGRAFGKTEVAAWSAALNGVYYPQARDAIVAWYRADPAHRAAYMQPGHLLAQIRAARPQKPRAVVEAEVDHLAGAHRATADPDCPKCAAEKAGSSVSSVQNRARVSQSPTTVSDAATAKFGGGP